MTPVQAAVAAQIAISLILEKRPQIFRTILNVHASLDTLMLMEPQLARVNNIIPFSYLWILLMIS